MGKVLFELLSDDAVLETTWGRSLAREYADSCDGQLPAFPDDETSSSIRPPPATSSASTVASWLPWVLAAVSSAVATWALLR